MKDISVVMGVYNEKKEYIVNSINSILGQSFMDFELIIILDNPFNNAAKDLLLDYKKKDNRIKILINDKNIGLAMSLNRGIDYSNGKYIARMDADDIALPNRLERQYVYMESHPYIDILGTNKYYIDEGGKVIGRGKKLPTTSKQVNKTLRYVNILTHPSVLMRKESIVKLGAYRDFPTSQDRDLWSRAKTANLNIEVINEYLINYRINSLGISVAKAYTQALISKYVRLLEKERIKKGTDSFSKQNLDEYLFQNKANDVSEINKYKIAKEIYEKGRSEFFKKRYLKGIVYLIKASFKHSLMRQKIYDILMVQIVNLYNSKM